MALYQQLITHGYACLGIFVLGAFLGSFYNVLIYRLPAKNLLQKARSHCRHCGAKIPIWLNIPCLSWFFLRGKTACCHQPLSMQYPLIEWLTATGFMLIYLYSPFMDDGELLWRDAIRFAHNSLLFSILLISSVIDFRHQIIPNPLTFGLILSSPVWAVIHPELDLKSSVVGIVVGGGVLYTIGTGYMMLKKKMGIGMGDVKFLAGIGGWLGYQAILPTLFTACMVGSLFGIGAIVITKKSISEQKVPFGPFLAGGALLYQFTGYHVIGWIFAA